MATFPAEGISFEEAVEVSSLPSLNEGDYPVSIKTVVGYLSGEKAKRPGRPGLTWTFVVKSENPKENGRNLFYRTPLPFEGEMSGIGFLVNLCKAVKEKWEGKDPGAFVLSHPEKFIGKSCTAREGIEEGSDGSKQNTIKKLF